MHQTTRSYGGMVVAPHHLAAEAGARVLRDGGNAIEAMIAAASTIAVVYPHMSGLGGDNFWLIHEPGEAPLGIDACGGAAALADIKFYQDRDCGRIPERGPLAALTVAGAVSGWQMAAEISANRWAGKMPMARLMEDAIAHAGDGFAVTRNLSADAAAKLAEVGDQPGFAGIYLTDGAPPKEAAQLTQPALAATLRHLASSGLDDFYRGELARAMADELEHAGSPLRLADFERYRALAVTPLALEVAGHRVFNMPPPTQGLASLLLLGVFERLGVGAAESFDYVHGLVEASKQAFRIRDRHITDPDHMDPPAAGYLEPSRLDAMAGDIDMKHAAPWPDADPAGDTVWLGAVDGQGRAVSFIQSLYWEFGSGVILPGSGITWQNRGTSFSLDPAHHNCLTPHRRPFHTIQPALAHLSDGRVMPYGAMGGEGQPQTQAMLFTRHVLYGQDLQQAVTAPRWLLGRTWGSDTTSLRIESRFDPGLYESLEAAGHAVEIMGEFEEVMGHAGALVHHPDGLIEGASDPRSDGAAYGF
ncbi:MAG: gamma-glutamyltransferase family protein [Hyphomicrobiales bacterium]